jgi:hypothetical protein
MDGGVAHMSWVKVREKFAALVAIVLVIVLAAVALTVFGYNIPVLSDISNALGIRRGP